MAFCPQCGSAAPGTFCPSCGASIGTAAANPAATAHPSIAAPVDDNVIAALCYSLWFITGVLFLVLEPYNRNKNIRFHALQSIFTGLALFAVSMSLPVLAYLPVVNLLFTLVTLAYVPFCFGLWLFLMYKAYSRERFIIPVLGELAQKQA
ncbi:MAG: hypothetical protein ABI811_19420 [Acidobacteriota bacterium]